jgi:hypothetical protein
MLVSVEGCSAPSTLELDPPETGLVDHFDQRSAELTPESVMEKRPTPLRSVIPPHPSPVCHFSTFSCLSLSPKSAKIFVGQFFLDLGGTEVPVSTLPIEDAGEAER